MSLTDLDRFKAACVYPGQLDEQGVERELAAFLRALGLSQRVVRLRAARDDPPRNRNIEQILDKCAKPNFGGRVLRAARAALAARAARAVRAVSASLNGYAGIDFGPAALPALLARADLPAGAAADSLAALNRSAVRAVGAFAAGVGAALTADSLADLHTGAARNRRAVGAFAARVGAALTAGALAALAAIAFTAALLGPGMLADTPANRAEMLPFAAAFGAVFAAGFALAYARVFAALAAVTLVVLAAIALAADPAATLAVVALACVAAVAAVAARTPRAPRAGDAARAFAAFAADPGGAAVTALAASLARAGDAARVLTGLAADPNRRGLMWELSWTVCALFDVVERGKPAVEAWLRPLFEAFVGGCWLLYWTDDTLYWVAKPTVHREPRTLRLHQDTHAALESDVMKLYFWHGVMVPPFVILTPDRITIARIDRETNAEVRRAMIERCDPHLITVARIDRETNAELRRVMIERYRHGEDIHGAAAFIRDAGGMRIDHDERYGTLWRRDIPGDEPIVMIEVVNRTGELDGSFKHYWLRVPPTMQTARQAVAWTFNMPTGRYAPEVET